MLSMLLLDNQQYVLGACEKVAQTHGYRVIPLGISCYLDGSLALTSLFNYIFILVGLFYLLKAYNIPSQLMKKTFFIWGGSSLLCFPVWYPAAHSYVYTLLACAIGLYSTTADIKKIHKRLFGIALSAVMLCLVRDEALFYFMICSISWIIYQFIHAESFKKFFTGRAKKQLIMILSLIGITFVTNRLFILMLDSPMHMMHNLTNPNYTGQFPAETFKFVGIWASLRYLISFFLPFALSFHGNYIDWYAIHTSPTLQVILTLLLTTITIVGTVLILKRKNESWAAFLIGLAVFTIPTFLISMFLRNQWYYPSRALIGAYISLPFFLLAVSKIKKLNIQRIFIWGFSIISIISFAGHKFYHFENEEKFYNYEAKFLGESHPVTSREYSRYIAKQGRMDEALTALREAFKKIPKDAAMESGSAFFLWSQNLYDAAQNAHFSNKLDVEHKALDILYTIPNYFAGLACLQDERISIEKCQEPIIKQFLCDKKFHRMFGEVFYKKSRMTLFEVCVKQNQ